jgi:hypothetical protein
VFLLFILIMVAKRKVAASTSATNKKARTDTSRAEALVQDILADPLGFEFSEDDDVVRQSFVDLANYISFLTDSLESAHQSGSSTGPAPKTMEELDQAAQKLAKAAVSGIKKQMNVRPSFAPVDTLDIYAIVVSGGLHARPVLPSLTMTVSVQIPRYLDTCLHSAVLQRSR